MIHSAGTQQGEDHPRTLYVFADWCGGEEPSRATSSVGDRGEWDQAVGMMMVAGIRGGLHETDVWMMIRVRAGQARATVVQADGTGRHAMDHAIHAATWMIGITADAAAPVTGAGALVAPIAAAGMTRAAAVADRQTAPVIGVIARCVAGVRRCATIGRRLHVGAAALVDRDTPAPDVVRHRGRAEASGAMSHGAAHRCATHATRAPRVLAAEDPWRPSRSRASSPLAGAPGLLLVCFCWASVSRFSISWSADPRRNWTIRQPYPPTPCQR
jgi:hypothetical protein